jgi:PITH domain
VNTFPLNKEVWSLTVTYFIPAEAVPRAGAAILQKPWTERLSDQPELESDADEQLLMHIPYVSLLLTAFLQIKDK